MVVKQLIPRAEASKWFEDVVPGLANLLLRFPSLLETHYQKADGGVVTGVNTGLRLLKSQESGVVFLSQVSWLLKVHFTIFYKAWETEILKFMN